ncbi:MAG: ATP-binding cassette domain-containing protein, partial [Phenylobacterium sp.]|nr:ATP-binding cassette domain-containing protein [Phenylobacterium sp.]
MTDKPLIIVEDLAKTFVLHNAEQATIPVFQDLTLQVAAGECVVLAGESGVGKSTLMRSIF